MRHKMHWYHTPGAVMQDVNRSDLWMRPGLVEGTRAHLPVYTLIVIAVISTSLARLETAGPPSLVPRRIREVGVVAMAGDALLDAIRVGAEVGELAAFERQAVGLAHVISPGTIGGICNSCRGESKQRARDRSAKSAVQETGQRNLSLAEDARQQCLQLSGNRL